MTTSTSEPLTTETLLSVQETPGMTTPLPWRVFKLTDCEWWVARTMAEAIEDYTRVTGEPVEKDDAHELTDADMDRLQFVDTDEGDLPIRGPRRSFSEELARRVAEGLHRPELFACTEY